MSRSLFDNLLLALLGHRGGLQRGLGPHGAPVTPPPEPAHEPGQERERPAGHDDPGDDNCRVSAEVRVRVEHDRAQRLRAKP